MAKLGSEEVNSESDIRVFNEWGGMARMWLADDSNEDKGFSQAT